jgi:hypothetical protein
VLQDGQRDNRRFGARSHSVPAVKVQFRLLRWYGVPSGFNFLMMPRAKAGDFPSRAVRHSEPATKRSLCTNMNETDLQYKARRQRCGIHCAQLALKAALMQVRACMPTFL